MPTPVTASLAAGVFVWFFGPNLPSVDGQKHKFFLKFPNDFALFTRSCYNDSILLYT